MAGRKVLSVWVYLHTLGGMRLYPIGGAVRAELMQAVILAGGLGTRLRPVTNTVPKSMAPVCGRPFLEYQLDALAGNGIDDVVVCLGHLGHMIEGYFGNGRRFGVSIRYGYERDGLLGTAGAIKNAEDLLSETFFVMYGDTYPILDFQRVMQHFLRHDRLGLMVVIENEDRWDRSNVIVSGPFVQTYDKHQKRSEMVHVDFGVSAFRRGAFSHLPVGTPTDLGAVYQALIEQQQLLAYETSHRFYEVGSPEGLREFEALMHSGDIRTFSLNP